MSRWRRTALELLPQHKKTIERAHSPMALWIELSMLFEDHVQEGNKEIIRKILDYASWCGSEKSGKLPNDTSTAVYCGFYEDIGGNKSFWPFLNQWFSKAEYEKLKGSFGYFLNEEEVKELNRIFYKKQVDNL